MCLSFTTYAEHFTWHFWSPNVSGFFSHTKQLCCASQVPYNVIQFWQCLPGDSVRSHILRARSYQTSPAPQMPMTSPGGNYKLEVPMLPSSGLIDLLRWLLELSSTAYLLFAGFYKGYETQCRWTPRWKRCAGQAMWEGEMSFHLLSQNLCVFTNLEEALQTPYFGDVLKLHHEVWFFVSSISNPSPLSGEEWVVGLKITLLIEAWSFWWSAPIQDPTKSHLFRTKARLSHRKFQLRVRNQG